MALTRASGSSPEAPTLTRGPGLPSSPSDLGTAVKIGLPGDFPPEFKVGDKVMIAKFSGRRHMDEEGNSYLVLPQSEVIAYEEAEEV